MNLSALWLAPLGVAALGALGLATAAVWLSREVDRLERSLRPLRATRIDRTRRPR